MAEERAFSWPDYLVFAGMLLISAVIGVYHGCKNRTKKVFIGSKSGEFLTANGQLNTLPVAVSMLASFLSSITLVGQPAEVYMFGPQLWLFGVAIFAAVPVVGYIFIPLYHRLHLMSAYEYFGQRYNRNLQLLASILFTLQMVLYLALVLYAPALALYQVTGLNTDAVVSVMYVIVIFYTTFGGMKAVVWTDCFQVLVLFIAMAAVLIKGTIDLGGVTTIWQRNAAADRGQFFSWNADPTERYTVWTSLIGAAFLHTAVYGVNQLQVQRYMTVGTAHQARKMLWINAVGWTLVVLLTVYAGMLIFAKYFDCDPLSTGVIQKPDQLLPFYVMDTLGDYPGFPGLLVAGIFSAGLSTVSTGLNSLAAIWFAELEGTKFKANLSETQAELIVKFLALMFGLLSFAMVFLVPYMGGLAPVGIALSSFFSGSLFGVFLLGMYIPWSNTVGASTGLLAGVGVMGWITIGAQVAVENGQAVFTRLPTYTHNCQQNITLPMISDINKNDAFILYRISFLWYSLLSTVITLVIGMIVSLLVPNQNTEMNKSQVEFGTDKIAATELLLSESVNTSKTSKETSNVDTPVHTSWNM